MIWVQLVNGLMEGMMLFLIASGLTLIFGVSRIVNFAHGSLYMLGAFLTYALVPLIWPGSVAGFFASILLAGLVTAAVGASFEMLALRRVYGSDNLMQLIITVALVFIIRDIVRWIWGPNSLNVPMPDARCADGRFRDRRGLLSGLSLCDVRRRIGDRADHDLDHQLHTCGNSLARRN